MPDWTLWPGFLLVLARCFGFIQASPFFIMRGQPFLARAGLVFFLTLLIYPNLDIPTGLEGPGLLGFGVRLAGELLVGLALGFLITLLISTFRTAGQLIDLQVGFAMVSLLDTEGRGRTSVMGEYLYLLGFLVFMLLDGHLDLLKALSDSFRVAPLGGAGYGAMTARVAAQAFGGMFSLALRIAMPVLGALLVLDVALGLVARTVPQLNVFMLAFPLKVGLGLIILGMTASLAGAVVGLVRGELLRDLSLLLRALRP